MWRPISIEAVAAGEGAHVCARGSHRQPPVVRWSDRWKVRRYSDDEIGRLYDPSDILELCGPAGTGFAERMTVSPRSTA